MVVSSIMAMRNTLGHPLARTGDRHRASGPPWPGFSLAIILLAWCPSTLTADAFDAAPWAQPLDDGSPGIRWEDPREVHRVVATFRGPLAATNQFTLDYWGSRWPEQRLPKDAQPGGGSVGWMELGHWFQDAWRKADTEAKVEGQTVTFTFRPVNATEFPELKDFPATFRTTLKLRIQSSAKLPPLASITAFTDSVWTDRIVRLVWRLPPIPRPTIQVFNGEAQSIDHPSPRSAQLRLRVAANPDPNSFDRTLVSVRGGRDAFTFAVDDLASGPLLVPHLGVAVLLPDDDRDYPAVVRDLKAQGQESLYDRVVHRPEQTWANAWEGMPPKKRPLYLPLGLDGGRQRFRLDPDGGVFFRSNDVFLQGRPGRETPRLALEQPEVQFRFGLPDSPDQRSLLDDTLPIGRSLWRQDGIEIEQTALVSPLAGLPPEGPPPEGDTLAVLLVRFIYRNLTPRTREARLPLTYTGGPGSLQPGPHGTWLLKDALRAQVTGLAEPPTADGDTWRWSWLLPPGESRTVVAKIPYVVLTEPAERDALAALDFDRELEAATIWWRHRLDQSARLLTPEPLLNAFYRSHAMHLLVNCEREPGSVRRFARVGSFRYGAFANESCMMVADLDRRGYHAEAQACLDAWLHYQSSVPLPGDFASQRGVLYGAGGYEAGGYNQHHGWILWCLAEHYRFTRNTDWLRSAAQGILEGADWIIRERSRTFDRRDLAAGLLPAGRLEDVGDWWFWLSTSCYTWRGLESAGWALDQIQHPEANRVKREAAAYHDTLLRAFREAAVRSPVVRLLDGTAVPKFPSHVHRRGRSFGWISETLEGALHLLITRALDPASPEAGWILRDYEDNLYLSHQWGYTLDQFERDWFGRGGISMQACLLLGVEPYLYRDDVKHALRVLFNAMAVSHFPDVRMNTEHALPAMGDWAGDHFKSSDEANAAGWLRQLFLREEGEDLIVGQALPREWLRPGSGCRFEQGATWFGPASIRYDGARDQIRATFEGAARNPPRTLRVRFREPRERPIITATVNGRRWTQFKGEWVTLPGTLGRAEIVANYE